MTCLIVEFSDPEAEAEQYRKYPDDFSQVFTLPDGQEIEIGTERYSCSEILYDPQELGLAQPSLPHLIMESIAR